MTAKHKRAAVGKERAVSEIDVPTHSGDILIALIVEPRNRIARVIEAEAVVLTLDEAAVYRQIRGIVAIDAVGIVR